MALLRHSSSPKVATHIATGCNQLTSVATAAKKFNSAKEIIFTRVTPKHTREIEIKSYIAEPLKVSKVDGETLLTFGTKINLDGTIKPSEVLKALNLPIEVTAAKINRTALLSHGKNLLDVI